MTEHTKFRQESDSLGDIEVPASALYQAQTQRAVENFPISQRRLPEPFIRALVRLKISCAISNKEQGIVDEPIANAIVRAGEAFLKDFDITQFPVDVFQTGSGTSTNMNANEVLASLASKKIKQNVHPNDHVNQSQSSNDVFPSSIQISTHQEIQHRLLPACEHLQKIISEKASSLKDVIKTGRTHLMDAVPLSMQQELSAWAFQIEETINRLHECQTRMQALPIGGTAIGTGLNSSEAFSQGVTIHLNQSLSANFRVCENRFARIATQDIAVECAGHLKTLAVGLMKISYDLRWMNSGPISGLSEIQLKELQPGSSIMPGKVNPVIPEAVAMVSAQVIGNEAAITAAGQSGNFQLNVMLPVIASNLLESVDILTNACYVLADKAIADFQVNEKALAERLQKNPILVTALAPEIGYDRASKIAKRAYAENKALIDIALEETELDEAQLKEILNPKKLI